MGTLRQRVDKERAPGHTAAKWWAKIAHMCVCVCVCVGGLVAGRALLALNDPEVSHHSLP